MAHPNVMRLFLENKILKNLAYHPLEIAKYPLIEDNKNPLIFGWPSFLAALDFEDIYAAVPAFDQKNVLFEACVATISSTKEKEVIFYLYDRLFAECLTRIKELPQLQVDYLFHCIAEKRQKLSHLAVESLYVPLLNLYDKLLQTHPSQIIHDLILYLAWDRMCVWVAALFDYQSTQSNYITGLGVLKECLVESFQHISQQGRVSPGFYRFIESLFFYEMREENLQKHTDEEWQTLSQSFHVLKGKEELLDVFYIDSAIYSEESAKKEEKEIVCFFTDDFLGVAKARIAFVEMMIHKLKREFPHWNYSLHLGKIVCLNQP